jgi:hypothetical protein
MMQTKKARIFAIAAGVLAVTSIPTVLLLQNLNGSQVQPTTFQTQPSATPSQTSEADELEAARLAQEAEQQAQAAAQQKAREDLIAYTDGVWQDLNTIVETGSSMSEDSEDSVTTLEYMLVEMEALPIAQADPQLATFIQDLYGVLYEAYQLEKNYRAQLRQMGFDILDAGLSGCDVAEQMVEENQLAWCIGAGLLTGTLVAADASEEAKQLEAEYNNRAAELIAQMDDLSAQFDVVDAYLSEEYGITAN